MEFEKLGVFYLGRKHDIVKGKPLDDLLLYDSRDLTTHAVCVGMTGSGKTGLCVDLLEEAAIDGVPAIIIDPKGDISNLLLTFPDLKPSDFRPWINTEDARRAGISDDEHAARQADLWKKGLAQWGQDGKRIGLLKDAADFAIFTPGSEAGTPVSILQSFSAPALDWGVDAELGRERIQATVSALLGLIGIEADPIRSREHILLSNIFEHFWKQGTDLELPSLIVSVQSPPFRKLGVFDIDTFFSSQERFELSMRLNALIAAPGFSSWMKGQPLDVAGLLATPDGRCRHSIMSIAHLSEAERMFFVTVLLNQVISWMRRQPGTSSLRALLYMDEIFGFFPPVANPPSKQPLLTLLKQARAYGVGVVLTTQNPVDLDYKGLGNAGTWFIGRLQADRDRARLLEGLQSASSASGRAVDAAALSDLISGLDSRVFLMHNVHDSEPVVFQTRWAMSYLRGPLTRQQIRQLSSGRSADAPLSTPLEVVPIGAASPGLPPAPLSPPAAGGGGAPPHLQPGISQAFLPMKVDPAAAALRLEGDLDGGSLELLSRRVLYRPAVVGTGRVHYIDRRRGVDEAEAFALMGSPPTAGTGLNWSDALPIDGGASLVEKAAEGASFESLPESINEPKEFKALGKDLSDHLYRTSAIELLYSRSLKLYSAPRENERDFRLRLQQALREKRDRDVDRLNRRYAPRLRRLENSLRRAEEVLAKRKTVSSSRKREVMVSLGESLLGVFMGRRAMRGASTTLSKYRQSKTAAMSIEAAEGAVEAATKEIAALKEELGRKVEDLNATWEDAAGDVERVPVTPRRADIDIDFCGLGWVPQWELTFRDSTGRTKTVLAPAF